MARRKRRRLRKLPIIIILTVVLLFTGYIAYNSGILPVKVINNFLSVENTDSKNDIKASSEDKYKWNLILVNRNNTIPKDYEIEFVELSNGRKVDSRIYPDLQKMFDAMRTQGIYPVVGEAYRTWDEQRKMMDNKIAELEAKGAAKEKAKEQAKEWVAVPGTSEHQLGLAVDINADKSLSTNDDVYNWLAQNAYKYGFILRYPKDKTGITYTEYEPWHYRYVGEKAAKTIYNNALCLEEYIKQYADK